ncbi:MAG: DUF5131 family protein [Christensenellales bacterium]|nr:DUF5131 family protein [Christensenellales bacterium]
MQRGRRYCYIHKGNAKRGVDTEQIVRTKGFDAPVRVKRDGTYKIKGGQTVYLCLSSDFLLEDAGLWREECWAMIRRRPDLHFLFLTKRIHRFLERVPSDWDQGYDNVTVGCTVEDQASADTRLPIKNRDIICQPLIGPVNLERYLDGVELVVVGGESDPGARPLDYAWVLSIREQCIRQGVHFEFRQCGTHFIKDGKTYTLPVRELCSQARKANINC